MQIGKKIAFAVESGWYRALVAHSFLKGEQLTEHPTDLLLGTVESQDDLGVWIKPDERYSYFPASSVLVPWRFIVSAIPLGQEEEKRLLGFSRTQTDR